MRCACGRNDARWSKARSLILLTAIATKPLALRKNFGRKCWRQGRERRNRSKNRESVPSDSRLQGAPRCFDVPLARVARDLVRCRRYRQAPHARRHMPTAQAALRDCAGSDAELGFQEIVDRLRARLAARRLHHLTDEPADRLRVRLRVSDLVGVLGDDLVHHPRDGG